MELTEVDPTPREGNSPVSKFPIDGSYTQPFFPPVCLRYHNDPTAVLRRVLPQGPSVPMAEDPRPWTKVCLDYVNSGRSAEKAPEPPKDMVFPSGGEFYPPTRYSESIDNESLLRRLDRPLGTCDKFQYEPAIMGDMYVPNRLVPDRVQQPSSSMVSELAFPKVLLRTAPYDCRSEADNFNMSKSPYLFNNATKQQRYNQPFRTKQITLNQAEKLNNL